MSEKNKRPTIYDLAKSQKAFQDEYNPNANIVAIVKMVSLVHFMLTTDRKYIIWTNDGYFSASPQLLPKIGYFEYNGEGNPARFISLKKFIRR